jgi:hypothetical protein
VATNAALKKALLEKLGITASGLSRRIKREQKILSMSTELATYLIAQESGIVIRRYLSDAEVTDVRNLQVQKAGVVGTSNNSVPNRQAPAKRTTAPRRAINAPSRISISDPILPEATLAEAAAMVKVYPMLYGLENSIRELIKRVMSDKFGKDWWDTELTSSKLKPVRDTANSRMTTEKTKHSWHQRRGSHPIDYVQFEDLGTILRGKKGLFHPDIIPDWDWLLHLFREVYPSRNVVCHMNPLNTHNSRDVESWYRKWANVMRNSRDKIPESTH